MPRDRAMADVMRELQVSRLTGAYLITVKQSSEDLFKLYIKEGEIAAVTYGSAVGRDALEILEYYTLANGTFFNGLAVPAGVPPLKFPMKKFIAMMQEAHQTIRIP